MSLVHNGDFIVIEGVEGSGKSTQSNLLFECLQEKKLPCLLTREPGGTRTGEAIREALLHGEKISGLTELFLFSAARLEIIDKIIEPALLRGDIVICDRFTASTTAYQGYGRGVALDHISYLNELSTRGLTPKLGFLLDIPPEVSFERKKGAAKDRIENEELRFHQLVRQGYLETAKSNPDAWTILDATESVTEIKSQIWNTVSSQLKLPDL